VVVGPLHHGELFQASAIRAQRFGSLLDLRFRVWGV